MNQIIKEGQDQITALITAGEPVSISDARAIVETTALAAVKAEQERVKKYLLGKEIVVTDGDGNKETVLRVGNFLAALEDWPDLPETTY